MNPVRLVVAVVLAGTIAACSTEPRSPGILWLSYSTKVGDELPFSWKLTFDDRAPITISSATTATTKFDSLSAGSHHMVVSNLPTHCTTGNDDRSIDVGGGDTVRLSIQVACTRVTGDVAITIATNGSDRDPDGYTLLVDGQPTLAIPPVPTVTRIIGRLTPGTHLFTLSGVASNCSVANGDASAFVTAGNSVLTSLTVNCTAISGNLRVTTTTSGGAALADPSGYIVTVGSVQALVAANGATPVSVPAGSYNVVLSDIEPNCTAPVTSKPVSVAVGVTTDVSFDITCGAYAPTTAAFSATDPAADTLPNPSNSSNKSFDVIGLTTRYASNYMTVTVRFSRPIGADDIIGYLDFDLDENAGTGVPPFMNGFGGSAQQGVEARLSFEAGSFPFGYVATTSGSFGQVRTTVDADSIRFTIGYDRFDNDDGNMTITAIVGSADRPTDLMPNAGVMVSHLPGTQPMMRRTRTGNTGNEKREVGSRLLIPQSRVSIPGLTISGRWPPLH